MVVVRIFYGGLPYQRDVDLSTTRGFSLNLVNGGEATLRVTNSSQAMSWLTSLGVPLEQRVGSVETVSIHMDRLTEEVASQYPHLIYRLDNTPTSTPSTPKREVSRVMERFGLDHGAFDALEKTFYAHPFGSPTEKQRKKWKRRFDPAWEYYVGKTSKK